MRDLDSNSGSVQLGLNTIVFYEFITPPTDFSNFLKPKAQNKGFKFRFAAIFITRKSLNQSVKMEPMDISDSPKLEIEASSSTLEAVEETCLFSDPRPEASEVIANSLSAERNEEVM